MAASRVMMIGVGAPQAGLLRVTTMMTVAALVVTGVVATMRTVIATVAS
jgi:hypothetical protein